jgi:glycosyltransferase involved in cell wall biosynthesis
MSGVFPLSYERPEISIEELGRREERLARMGIRSDRTVIWFVGTFGQTYDIQVPILAARRLAAVREDLLFVLSGDGERGEEWRALAHGLDNVVFTGWVDKLGLASLSSRASVGLMAYTAGAPQGLPNKIFEYMSAGIPILSSLTGETQALLEDKAIGFNYHAGEVDDFIAKLLLLADDPAQTKRMGDRAKEVFEAEFSPEMVYSALVDFLERTAAGYSEPSHRRERM